MLSTVYCNSMRVGAAALLVTLSGCSGSGTKGFSAHDQAVGEARVKGRIVMRDGADPEAFHVALSSEGAEPVRTKPDKKGAFTLEGVKAGKATLAVHDGQGNGVMRPITVYAGGSNATGDLALEPLVNTPQALAFRGIGYEEVLTKSAGSYLHPQYKSDRKTAYALRRNGDGSTHDLVELSLADGSEKVLRAGLERVNTQRTGPNPAWAWSHKVGLDHSDKLGSNSECWGTLDSHHQAPDSCDDGLEQGGLRLINDRVLVYLRYGTLDSRSELRFFDTASGKEFALNQSNFATLWWSSPRGTEEFLRLLGRKQVGVRSDEYLPMAMWGDKDAVFFLDLVVPDMGEQAAIQETYLRVVKLDLSSGAVKASGRLGAGGSALFAFFAVRDGGRLVYSLESLCHELRPEECPRGTGEKTVYSLDLETMQEAKLGALNSKLPRRSLGNVVTTDQGKSILEVYGTRSGRAQLYKIDLPSLTESLLYESKANQIVYLPPIEVIKDEAYFRPAPSEGNVITRVSLSDGAITTVPIPAPPFASSDGWPLFWTTQEGTLRFNGRERSNLFVTDTSTTGEIVRTRSFEMPADNFQNPGVYLAESPDRKWEVAQRVDPHTLITHLEISTTATPDAPFRRVTFLPTDHLYPLASADSAWIYYFADVGGVTQLLRVSAHE